jgi:hypothetical protein
MRPACRLTALPLNQLTPQKALASLLDVGLLVIVCDASGRATHTVNLAGGSGGGCKASGPPPSLLLAAGGDAPSRTRTITLLFTPVRKCVVL